MPPAVESLEARSLRHWTLREVQGKRPRPPALALTTSLHLAALRPLPQIALTTHLPSRLCPPRGMVSGPFIPHGHTGPGRVDAINVCGMNERGLPTSPQSPLPMSSPAGRGEFPPGCPAGPSHPPSWDEMFQTPPAVASLQASPGDSILCQHRAQGCQAALPKHSLIRTALGSGSFHSSSLVLQG